MKIGHKFTVLFLPTTLFSLMLIFGLSFFLYQFFISTPDAEKEYQALMRNADPSKLESTPYVATQQHRQSHKDIWYTKEDQRMQLCLRSVDTELVLDHHDDNTELIEHMKDVTCYMQEELYYLLQDGHEVIKHQGGESQPEVGIPMQVIRYMKADTATYNYQTDHFFADNVQVSRYIIPGHQITFYLSDSTPLMHGIASSVEFSLVGNELNFTAHQLKATLHSPGKK